MQHGQQNVKILVSFVLLGLRVHDRFGHPSILIASTSNKINSVHDRQTLEDGSLAKRHLRRLNYAPNTCTYRLLAFVCALCRGRLLNRRTAHATKRFYVHFGI